MNKVLKSYHPFLKNALRLLSISPLISINVFIAQKYDFIFVNMFFSVFYIRRTTEYVINK